LHIFQFYIYTPTSKILKKYVTQKKDKKNHECQTQFGPKVA